MDTTHPRTHPPNRQGDDRGRDKRQRQSEAAQSSASQLQRHHHHHPTTTTTTIMPPAVKKEEGNEGNGAVESILLTKPGQKYPTPTPGVAERIFYETLLQQRPERWVRVCTYVWVRVGACGLFVDSLSVWVGPSIPRHSHPTLTRRLPARVFHTAAPGLERPLVVD
jgi:hypothetical protein